MSILLDNKTRVLVQGITGKVGSIQTRWMLDYGTNIVAGVTPGKGGITTHGVPVFDSVEEAVDGTGAEASVFFVPASFVMDAFYETVDAGIGLIVVVPEHIPVHDVLKMRSYAQQKNIIALGPTTPGIMTPGKAKMGIMPGSLFKEGRVGIISRSGTLAYEVAGILAEQGIGQSTVVGMGADPVVLSNMEKILELFERDNNTDAVLIVGEVGGMQEEKSAVFIAESMTKPVAAYIAGRYSPEGKRMGHAGAIIRGSAGTVDSKCQALAASGVEILETPGKVADWAKNHNLK
ncbi:MAG: succinate--CoA ligase subunit alpha [Candidatus Latescibacteria bacterium]|nr:succinate--CoA ligase subunit alpha [Candidatus Latescibacterota bacterium]